MALIDPSESLTLDFDAVTRAADALSGPTQNGRNHQCRDHDDGVTGCRICWELAGDVIRAAEGLRKCPHCNGGGIVAPGSCCPECGGNGLAVLRQPPGQTS